MGPKGPYLLSGEILMPGLNLFVQSPKFSVPDSGASTVDVSYVNAAIAFDNALSLSGPQHFEGADRGLQFDACFSQSHRRLARVSEEEGLRASFGREGQLMHSPIPFDWPGPATWYCAA